jgi:hypothetical protein
MKTDLTSVKAWILAMMISLSLLVLAKVVSRTVQSSSQDNKEAVVWKVKKTGPKRMGSQAKAPDSLDNERIIEDQIPPGVPIEVEIKNIKTVSLLRDIEIKVTNTAKKPIYFIELGIVLPDNLSPDGYPHAFPLRYGRPELIKFENPLEPNDMPLQPGESCVLKIPENNRAGFEGLVAKGKITQSEIKTVYLMFRDLNFGDKTGFSGGGSPIPQHS